ncbi:MAG: DUF2069 domain-containing protein [Azoarcus sp.]|jgi:uncharacterized membrane protein|nr:DUF2069 domain-containing protein [Azoarcus sp.]
MSPRLWSLFARIALLALIALCVVWEGWFMPLRPVMLLKVLPLLLAVPGVFCGRRYTSQWLSMIVLLYFLEGAWRLFDPAPSGDLARVEIALVVALFVAAIGHARSSAPSRR